MTIGEGPGFEPLDDALNFELNLEAFGLSNPNLTRDIIDRRLNPYGRILETGGGSARVHPEIPSGADISTEVIPIRTMRRSEGPIRSIEGKTQLQRRSAGHKNLAPLGRPGKLVTHLRPKGLRPFRGDLEFIGRYSGRGTVTRRFAEVKQGAVGMLVYRPQRRGVGSGTLIAPDLFLTAAHIFRRRTRNPQDWEVAFNYQYDGERSLRARRFRMDSIVEFRRGGIDYTVLRLRRNPGYTFGWTRLSPTDARFFDRICVIQHPRGERKQIESGTSYGLKGEIVRYADLDTLPGSSGAGILGPEGTLVGVHTDGGNPRDAKIFNWGVRITKILNVSTVCRDLMARPWPLLPELHALARKNGFVSAHGPLEPFLDRITFVATKGTVRSASDAAMMRFQSPSDSPSKAHRWAREQGFVGGFGPVDHRNGKNSVVAFQRGEADLKAVADEELSPFGPSGSIDEFAHRWARDKGYVTGIWVDERRDGKNVILCIKKGSARMYRDVPVHNLESAFGDR